LVVAASRCTHIVAPSSVDPLPLQSTARENRAALGRVFSRRRRAKMADANKAGSRSSVWDTLAAMKARHSAAERDMEREKETLRLRRDAVAAVAAVLNGAASDADPVQLAADALRSGGEAVNAMLADQKALLKDGGDGATEKETAELVALQKKACLDLDRARTVLCRTADDREMANSRAGRLEYKVRD
jgi:hypothetical protein